MIQLFLFSAVCRDLESALRSLSGVAELREESGFYFFRQLPGQPEFQFDCELVSGGLMTERKGDYFAFLGRFVDALTSRFGAVEIGPEGALLKGDI